MPRIGPTRRSLKNRISTLETELQDTKSQVRTLEREASKVKPYGFTVTETEDGTYDWAAWRKVRLPTYSGCGTYYATEYETDEGVRMPYGTKKTARAAEIAARKALVPFQVQAVQVTKTVC